MLAHHPTTGQPIRILRTKTQIARTQTTLVVLSPTMTPSPLYSRYTVVIADPAAAAVSPVVHIAIVRGDVDAWSAVLPGLFRANPDLLLFASAAAASSLTSDRVLVIEDLADAYPWLGEAIRPERTEHVLLAVAHLLRFKRLLWPYSVEREAWPLPARLVYDAWSSRLGGVVGLIGDNDSCIPRTTLIQQYYKSSQGRRGREINACLEKNLASPYIDRVLLLNEEEFKDLPVHPKLTATVSGKRLTYYDALTAAKEHVPAGDFVIISNSDIWFEASLSHLWSIPLQEQSLFLALLRWEDAASGSPHLFGPRADSQDTWIVARNALTFPLKKEELDYPFGQSGCDNAIALDMMRAKMLVVNPAYTIKTMHLHRSNVRTYDPKNILYRPHYLHLEPTAIQSSQVLLQLDGLRALGPLGPSWNAVQVAESFCRPILVTNPAYERTVCKMLQATHQEGTVQWNYVATSQNRHVPPATPLPLYHIKGGAFVSASGLVSDWNQMIVGPHKRWATGWEGATQTLLTQCIQVESALAIPFHCDATHSLSRWVLDYVPHVLRLYGLLIENGCTSLPEFGAPSGRGKGGDKGSDKGSDNVGEFLSYCVWPGLKGKSAQEVHVLPLMDDVQVYATEVYAVPPRDEPAPITQEDVRRLRTLLPPFAAESGDAGPPGRGPNAVLCVSNDPAAVLTREWADSVSEHMLGRGWTIQTLVSTDSFASRADAYRKADWIIGEGEALDWTWCAKEGATVLEFMKAGEPDGSHIHLSGAAGLKHVVCLLLAEPIAVQRQHALLEVGRAIAQFGFKELLPATRNDARNEVRNDARNEVRNELCHKTDVVPVLTLPKGRALSGLFAHSGDTFREMARIWAERGYCRIQESEFTGHCWWGEIGEILLYDRPTLRWYDDSLTYQMALFGNCAPNSAEGKDSKSTRHSVWSFWPRSPRSIEDLVAKHRHLLTYEERTIPSLFLGKVENGVQLAARKGKDSPDWSTAVSLFSMPIDSTGAPYPYTQAEYLDKLCHARFGLCLRGFGPKCNREIEYFACGVVPIVTPDVDMTNYLVAPKAGVHYLVAKTPEDVRRIVAETTAEVWSTMSTAGRAWWRAYASAEGMFRLTWARIEQCRPYFTVGIPPHFPS